eukprot:m.111289 g.111289  ORF g.111289 m.111289 type:complete len:566 (+) comp28109_c0_seq2:190-1887(+)
MKVLVLVPTTCLFLAVISTHTTCTAEESASNYDNLHVQTKQGWVQGRRLDDGIVSFIGIPFGESTANGARFTAPQPKRAWNHTIDCTQSEAKYCPQSDGDVTMESEDCLSLSIWIPPSVTQDQIPTYTKLLPVLVWIFGGGFEEGSSDDWTLHNLTKNGASLGHPTIVISLNYRLGALGFLALPELGVGNGNFGLLDQRLALQWVQDNIAEFGGDASRVAIWGQSAGGQSVCFHLASPASATLFSRAISSSGPCTLPYPPLAEAQRDGVDLAERLAGCTNATTRLQCLRGLPMSSKILTSQPRASPHDGFLYPTIDGTDIGWPQSNQLLFARGHINKVPTMFGSADDDLGAGFASGLVARNLSASSYIKYLQAVADSVSLGESFLRELMLNYPLSRRNKTKSLAHDSVAFATLLDLVGDSNIGCTAFDTAMDVATSANGPPTYVYNYVYRAKQMGYEALHASDLPLFFGDDGEFDTPAAFTPVETKLRDVMQRDLLHFVATGKPFDPDWKPVNVNGSVKMFDETSVVVGSWKHERCAMWRRQRQQTHWLGDSELKQIFHNVSTTA